MFSYNEVEILYWATCGFDSSNDIPYDISFTEKEAAVFTKARMLGKNLDDEETLSKIYSKYIRQIIRYEASEYGTDLRNYSVSFSFCDNGQQPPVEDIKEYLKDLLTAHKIKLAHDVVLAQINEYDDTENKWPNIALELAAQVDCQGYIKRYKNEKITNIQNEKEMTNNESK